MPEGLPAPKQTSKNNQDPKQSLRPGGDSKKCMCTPARSAMFMDNTPPSKASQCKVKMPSVVSRGPRLWPALKGQENITCDSSLRRAGLPASKDDAGYSASSQGGRAGQHFFCSFVQQKQASISKDSRLFPSRAIGNKGSSASVGVTKSCEAPEPAGLRGACGLLSPFLSSAQTSSGSVIISCLKHL